MSPQSYVYSKVQVTAASRSILPDHAIALDLRTHPFCRGMSEAHIATLTHCTRYCNLQPGQYLWRQGERAETCLLILSGEVSLEIGVPGDHAIQVELLKAHDVLGWSWLLDPYRWHFDARAVTAVRSLALDTKTMRSLCASDHDFGYEILRRCTPLIAERLERTRRLVLELSRPT